MSKAGLEPAPLICKSDIEPIGQPGAPQYLIEKFEAVDFHFLFINLISMLYLYFIFNKRNLKFFDDHLVHGTFSNLLHKKRSTKTNIF